MPEGRFVAVVGPSGSGKDSLISAAARHFHNDARFFFVRRVITREVDQAAEDHAGVSVAEFLRLKRDDAFALTWDAHGLSYGIPREARLVVERGGIAVANCSRSAIGHARRVFGRITIVQVTADIDILADRLAGRGREAIGDIFERLERAAAGFSGQEAATIIKNNGLLEQASASFVKLLEKTANSL